MLLFFLSAYHLCIPVTKLQKSVIVPQLCLWKDLTTASLKVQLLQIDVMPSFLASILKMIFQVTCGSWRKANIKSFVLVSSRSLKLNWHIVKTWWCNPNQQYLQTDVIGPMAAMLLCLTLNIPPNDQVHMQQHFASIWTKATIWWCVNDCTVFVCSQAIRSKNFPVSTFFFFNTVVTVKFTSWISKTF